MGTWRITTCWAATALWAIFVTGCTTTISGAGQKQPGPPPTTVQSALLDHGNYPTQPRPPLGKVQSAFDGRVLEGDRMANNVVLPYEVDPTLLLPLALQTLTIKDSDALSADLPDTEPAAAAAHNFIVFIVGFSTSRTSAYNGPSYKALTDLVMEFPDPSSAAAAAGDMAAKYANPAAQQSTFNDNKPQQPFGIPRHPEALGSTSTDALGPDYKNQPGFIVSAFTAHGQYVLFQWAESTGDVGTPAEPVARILDMQGPLIDRFMPAAPSQFGDLPADPTGLLARTLPVAGNDAGINTNAVFEPRAFLHFADEPSKLADAFKQTGVQAVAVGRRRCIRPSTPPPPKVWLIPKPR